MTLAATGALATAYAPPVAAATTYTVQALHFLVHTDPAGSTACDIVGDLYTPTAASPSNRVPAILTSNGFGGSKADQAGFAALFAQRGYEVLSYSGLGFGGSGCKVTLDDPDYDGKAASQLVSFLGGKSGIAFADAAHTQAAPVLNVVRLDTTAHNGAHLANDPRVGTIGGSYGGGFQFAVASVDPRVDTIVPAITWNDLSYALGPNNTTQNSGVSSTTPGAVKVVWGAGFSVLGAVDGVQGLQADPGRIVPCPNLATWICPTLIQAGVTGYLDPAGIANLRHASVASYMSKIKVPTLLLQGEIDDLFNLNEAAATYRALKAQGTPVQMIWQSWGHSGSDPRGGEFSMSSPSISGQYETGRVANWFDHYLKGAAVGTGPNFAYFRDWIGFSGNAAPAYAASATFPVGTSRVYHLDGAAGLTQSATAAAGTQTFIAGPLGLPTSGGAIDALGIASGLTGLPIPSGLPDQSLPATSARWATPALSGPLAVAGSPVATLRFNANLAHLTQVAGPGGQLVVFLRIVDVAPDGSASPIDFEIAPVRIPDSDTTVTIRMPALVHQFKTGHSIGLQVLGGSPNYRGDLVASDVTVASGMTQTLSLPIVPN